MKFTKEEISLCKQVAKRYRREIGKGDWYVCEDSHYRTGWSSPMLNISDYEPVKKKLPGIFNDKDRNDVPLWTISDCLDFLRTRDWIIELKNSATPKYGRYYCACFMPRGHPSRKHGIYKYGNTTLETCLKAVLAVLKEVK